MNGTSSRKARVSKMYSIKVWIPVPIENPESYTSKEDAERYLASMELMQPENKYERVEV